MIIILHENEEWIVPLREALKSLNADFNDWHLDEGIIPFSELPPEAVFYNRMSASSHTRGHRWGPEYALNLLAWLERHDRTVVNGSRAAQLEVSKLLQYAELERFDLPVPKTYAAVGKAHIMEAAQKLDGPFITKHNRAGKGLGVQLFRNLDALQSYIDGPNFDPPIDGITLLQEYIQAPQPFITRMEFIGGKFHYAVRVDTSQGFELCPADSCQIGDQVCPATGGAKFQIIEDFESDLIAPLEKLLAANDVQVAGVEFIVDTSGQAYIYDINTNTNYNAAAEKTAGIVGGMEKLAEWLMLL